jgi:hypothetical protein
VSTDLERDLNAWARGELARERLLDAHAEAAGTVALHERLTAVAATTPIPNAEPGWATLLARIEAPAPVVPLRRHARRRRTVALLVAAALVVGGSALAAILGASHRGVSGPTPSGASTGETTISVTRVFGPNDRRLVPPPAGPSAATGSSGKQGSGSSTGGTGTGDATGTGGDAPAATDDPHDRDHGTGNDGSHDDQGGGNDGPTGSLPRGSNGRGH